MLHTTYFPGGYQPGAPAGNRAREYDDTARTVTTWTDAGQQIAQRPFTATENAAADMAATRAQQNTNAGVVSANLLTLITSLQADVTQDNSVITGANTIIATSGTLSALQLSNFVRQLAQAVKALASNDINNKRALANLLHKVTDDYGDLTGTEVNPGG